MKLYTYKNIKYIIHKLINIYNKCIYKKYIKYIYIKYFKYNYVDILN